MSTKTISLYFRGAGGEFVYHRLNKKEAYEVKAAAPSDFDDNPALHPSNDYERSIFSGGYSPNPFDMEVSDEDSGESIDLSKVEFVKDDRIDDLPGGKAAPEPETLDYIYITKTKVFGTVEVKVPEGEDFDPSKLAIHCVEYSLDGYPEEYGAVITAISYGGEPVDDCDFEDNGAELEVFLFGYEFEGDEMIDCIPVFSTKFDSSSLDFEKLDQIFKD